MPVPFIATMGRLFPKRMIFIGGIPHENAKRITVDLYSGKDPIGFHFDIRFQHIGDHNVIVRNARNPEWGIEERNLPGQYFPFERNIFFEMVILADEDRFKVAVNSQHLLEFKYRILPLSCVDTLHITGDIRLTHVKIM